MRRPTLQRMLLYLVAFLPLSLCLVHACRWLWCPTGGGGWGFAPPATFLPCSLLHAVRPTYPAAACFPDDLPWLLHWQVHIRVGEGKPSPGAFLVR